MAKDGNNNHYYLILQYADGGNLRDYLSNNFENLNWNDKIRIAKEIASGLIFLHTESKIIHRDLVRITDKLRNFLLKNFFLSS